MNTTEPPRIGVYVCHCGLNIADSVNCPEVSKFEASLPHVVVAKDNLYSRSDQGAHKSAIGSSARNEMACSFSYPSY